MSNKRAFLFFPMLLCLALVVAALPLCVAQNGAKLPADFPKDIPLYKNARFVKTVEQDPALGKSYIFDTADPVDTVIAFYKAQLPAGGWTITKVSFVANPNTITVTKGKQMVMVSPNRVMADGGGQVTRIDITVMTM